MLKAPVMCYDVLAHDKRSVRRQWKMVLWTTVQEMIVVAMLARVDLSTVRRTASLQLVFRTSPVAPWTSMVMRAVVV